MSLLDNEACTQLIADNGLLIAATAFDCTRIISSQDYLQLDWWFEPGLRVLLTFGDAWEKETPSSAIATEKTRVDGGQFAASCREPLLQGNNSL